MTELIRYDAMLFAIAECHQVDEVKDIRDKAMALEAYARQAKNTDAERKACDVRMRAERRAGELLKELARSQGQRNDKLPANVAGSSEYQDAIDKANIPARTARRFQELANVPVEQFESALRDPVRKPTTNALIQKARDPQPQLPADVLWLWGRARDFERDGFADKDPDDLLSAMTETMRADMDRIVPVMVAFFERFQEALLHEHA